MLRRSCLGEEELLLVSLAVAIGVGEDKDVGRDGDDHLVAQNADPHSRIDITSLVKDGRLVGLAVAIGIFQDHDAVARRPATVSVR